MKSGTLSPRRQLPVRSIGLLILVGSIVFLSGIEVIAPAQAQNLELDTSEVTSGLVRPLAIADPNDGTDRLFIVEQDGKIQIWNGTSLEPTAFLDISSQVASGNQQGILGFAFHPDYASSGEFFVNYTRNGPKFLQIVISRFTVSDADPDQADAMSEEILLVIDHELPNASHSGGGLAFGPDGYLYITVGDGGGSGDPFENGQDLSTLLGAVLRIDVDSPPEMGLAYAIPSDNPFVGQAGAQDEIWSYGLRNPFRFSFDRDKGDMWIGDVGQNAWEEIDHQPADSEGGENYGWDCREGAHDYTGPDNDGLAGCAGLAFIDPVLEYSIDDGSGRCSVTGGYRYRGDNYPQLHGVYLYADFCTGEIFGSVPRCDASWESQLLLDTSFNISTFGEDSAGEIYITERRGSGNPVSKVHQLMLAAGSGGPNLSASPSPLDYGNPEAGDTITAILTLQNINLGPEAVMVTNHTLSDPAQFTVDFTQGPNPCQGGGQLCRSPGDSCTLAVSLKAEFSGVISETLTFEGNFENETIALQANVLPCSSDQNLTVSNLIVTKGESETRRACDTLTIGPNVTVESGGELMLRAGTRISINDTLNIKTGGRLSIEVF